MYHCIANKMNTTQDLYLLTSDMAIRQLVSHFSDAANLLDAEAFQRLWTEDGVWEIKDPLNKRFEGKSQMAKAVTGMLSQWEFFVQLSPMGVVSIQEDQAKGRFYINEVARNKDGTGHYNLGVYEDEFVRVDGNWLFQKRIYHILYLDNGPKAGQCFPIPHLETINRPHTAFE